MSTETPLNARQWLDSLEGMAWKLDQFNGTSGPISRSEVDAHICEGYARAVLAEAERALRECSEAMDCKHNVQRREAFEDAADLLAGMRRP